MSFDPILKLDGKVAVIAEAFVMLPADFDRFIISETAKAQEVVCKAGLKLD
jgi:hypothetical protein